MTTLPLDIEAWADREAELEQLFAELQEVDAKSDAETTSPDELRRDLAGFSGTERYHRTHPGLLATDGAKYLTDEAGAYWLLDIVWSVLSKIADDFAVLELSVQQDRRAAVRIHDGREPETTYHEQEIAWTDFVLPSTKLYIQQNGRERVVMLPSEY